MPGPRSTMRRAVLAALPLTAAAFGGAFSPSPSPSPSNACSDDCFTNSVTGSTGWTMTWSVRLEEIKNIGGTNEGGTTLFDYLQTAGLDGLASDPTTASSTSNSFDTVAAELTAGGGNIDLMAFCNAGGNHYVEYHDVPVDTAAILASPTNNLWYCASDDGSPSDIISTIGGLTTCTGTDTNPLGSYEASTNFGTAITNLIKRERTSGYQERYGLGSGGWGPIWGVDPGDGEWKCNSIDIGVNGNINNYMAIYIRAAA